MVSSELIWQCVKGSNSYLRKGLNGTILSAEPGNLTSKHSFKFSGIANDRTVDLRSDKDFNVVLSKSRPKALRSKKSKSGKNTATTVFKKDARRVMRGVEKEVAGFRSDLQNVAVRRASALSRSARAAKAASK